METAGAIKPLEIIWQRLVDRDGSTCPRCSETHKQIEAAMDSLHYALRPLGFVPKLVVKTLDIDAFKTRTLESNRIWIAGRPMEEWLRAKVGTSPCCSVCGDSECRTLEVGGAAYEAIPKDLLVVAALIAALSSIGQQQQTSGMRR